MAFTYAGYYENVAFNKVTNTLAANTLVHIYLPNTTTPATLYTARDKLATVSTVTTDDAGRFSFNADPGAYDIKIGTETAWRVKVTEDPGDTLSPDQINVANGVAGLDATATLPLAQLPVGIPKANLAASVQVSLNKADTAIQTSSAVTTSLGKADTAVQPSSGLTASLAKADTALQLNTPAAFESRVGTVTAYTLVPTDSGKVLGFGAGGSAAITITMPNNLPVGFNVGVLQEGSGRITFAAASGGTVANRQAFLTTAGFLALAGLFVRYNASGTQAAGLIYGDVAA